jgi:hypothetical protein
MTYEAAWSEKQVRNFTKYKIKENEGLLPYIPRTF